MNINYIEQYKELYKIKPNYGKTSIKFLDTINTIIRQYGIESILDYGCGRSILLDELSKKNKISVSKYDPAIEEYSLLPSANCDFIICTDVLQHIPIHDLDNTMKEIRNYNCDCFFHVRSSEYKTKLPNGQNANCTVKNKEWWQAFLEKYYKNVIIFSFDDDTVTFITNDFKLKKVNEKCLKLI